MMGGQGRASTVVFPHALPLLISFSAFCLSIIDQVRLMQGNICGMHQIEDESVDAVMVNQVIHHLFDESVADGTDPFHAVRAAFRDIHRVLRPGTIPFSTQTHRRCGCCARQPA